MRIGTNPEKNKNSEIVYKKHRIIIPVYIPESKDVYFENLLEVFKVSMNSLFSTISNKQTAITIINNNCKSEVTEYINKLSADKMIDKHVLYSENYGKVYTILSEARSSYEDYITIADADVFYFNDWEKEVFKIFENFDRAGVVAPLPSPHLALYNNISLFGSFFRRPKQSDLVSPKSFSLFEEGTNNPKIFNNKKYNLKKEQFYLENNNVKSCIGSGHFIATYKNIFSNMPLLKPYYIFKDGDENYYLDTQFDKLGYYRMSTIDTKAYHLGNTIPKWVYNYKFNQVLAVFSIPVKKIRKSIFNEQRYFFKTLIFKFFKKINIL